MVYLVVEGQSFAVGIEHKLVLGHEGARQRQQADGHVGHGQADKTDMHRALRKLGAAAHALSSQHEDAQGVADDADHTQRRNEHRLQQEFPRRAVPSRHRRRTGSEIDFRRRDRSADEHRRRFRVSAAKRDAKTAMLTDRQCAR